MKKIIRILLVIFALSIPSIPLNIWADDDIIINVEEGSFVFKNLNFVKARESYAGITLKGDIVNNTSKDWTNLKFEIDLYDTSGNKIKGFMGIPFNIPIGNIKGGATESIGHGYGQYLNGTKNNDTFSRYEIKFKSGDYKTNYSFGMTKPKVSKDLIFEDTYIKISFAISKKHIGFMILNKTSDPIKIDWNQVSYIDVLNEAHKIMHQGVKYMDRANIQSPTIIPPTAKIEDFVFPTDHASYVSGRYGGWKEIPIFPEAPKARLFKGKTFSVFMPLEINGTVKNYLFTFIVEDVSA